LNLNPESVHRAKHARLADYVLEHFVMAHFRNARPEGKQRRLGAEVNLKTTGDAVTVTQPGR
jgi:hypothetical protein